MPEEGLTRLGTTAANHIESVFQTAFFLLVHALKGINRDRDRKKWGERWETHFYTLKSIAQQRAGTTTRTDVRNILNQVEWEWTARPAREDIVSESLLMQGSKIIKSC
jgi:hypothetical protein